MDSGIRRQLGSEANRLYLRNLPIFRVERGLPRKLSALLEEIERAEQMQAEQRD